MSGGAPASAGPTTDLQGSGGIRADIPASRTIPGRSVTGCWAFTPDGRFHSRRARRPASCARGLSLREEAADDLP